MLAISIAGARIARLDNVRPAHRRQTRLIEAIKLEGSSQCPCSEASIMFISGPHDRRVQFLRPTGESHRLQLHGTDGLGDAVAMKCEAHVVSVNHAQMRSSAEWSVVVLERVAPPQLMRALARDQSASPAQRCIRRTLDGHAGRPIAASEQLVEWPRW